jgi:radical SAM-linked protein
MATAVAAAYRLGQLLDGWTEHFDYARWAEAFRAMEREHGISAEQVAHRERAETEILPWDHLSAGVEKSFLLAERARSRSEVVLENCASGRCSACGACDFDRIVNRIFPPGSMQPEPAIEVSEPAALERALVRIRYSKTGRAVAVSHLESMTLLHRALRRSGLPIAFTQGFNPRPRVSLGPACPVGIESMAEYFDVELTRALEPRVIAGALDSQMPTGFRIMEVEAIDPSTPSLSASIEWIAYRARLGSDANEEMTRAVERFQSAGTVQVIRRKKGRDGAPQPAGPPQRIIDLKKVVLDLTLEGPREVRFRLRARNEASAKPAEVLEALFGRDRDPRVIKDSVQFAPSGRLQGGR